MKLTLSLLTLLVVFVGFALIGDALAQPDNPSPAATEDSGDGSAADEAKPEDTKADEAKPEDKPSEPASEEKEAGEEKAEGEAAEAPEGAVDQAKGLFSSVKGGQWMLAFGFMAMLVGSILRYAMKLKWKFWESEAGGYTIAGITGLAALGANIVSSGSFSMDGLMLAATIMITAMGLHGPGKAVAKKLKPAE